MSNESENKRIDLTQFEGRTEGSWLERTGGNMARWIVRGQFLENAANEALICAAPDLLAELKRCYEREDALVEALQIIREDLQEARAYGAYTLEQSERLRKIGNFANDASE